jgi:hypothetical protein
MPGFLAGFHYGNFSPMPEHPQLFEGFNVFQTALFKLGVLGEKITTIGIQTDMAIYPVL